MLSRILNPFSKNITNNFTKYTYSKDKFIKYIDSTNNLCIYKLDSQYIPKNIIFPKADTVTLINCNKNGILNILTPSIFPNLSNINYLSTNPGDLKIYERFNNNINWIFPNKSYDFYDYMVKSGRGRKDSELINKYITSTKFIDGKNCFDISFHFELNIPGFGIVDGEWWRVQLYEYFLNKQKINNSIYCMYPGEKIIEYDSLLTQENEELLLQKEYVKKIIDKSYYDYINENDVKIK